ncbi:MAG: HK97 gp10 family phage protein [Marinobacter maritimus]|jgi:HK97 gp10 family phage protein
MASDGVSFSVDGLEEVLGKFDALEYDIKRQGGRFALRRAAQVLRDQARANASRVDDPATPEDIAANIVERWSGRTFKRSGNMMFRVGVMGGAGGRKSGSEQSSLAGGDTRHWRHLEFGTEDTPAQPIFRPVPGQAGQKAMDEFTSQYEKKIDRVLKAAKKKAAK